ncbi:hypothetical protein ACIQUG_32345 [Ensifer sp. NPDC090286]|uniref:hypothetical protein n=1 Tax=Ensifer sp. NPDC090286 TaxID=3363991 RepID=UPI00383B6F93
MGDFSYGNMLRFVRENWRFTQEDLATRMEEHVADKRGVRRKNAIRTAISQMETGARPFRPDLRSAAARVLDIPEDWFLYPAPSMAAVGRNLTKLRQQQKSGRKLGLSTIAKQLPKPQQPSSLPMPNAFFREPERENQLQDALRLMKAPGPALIVIEGLSGYGKSSFASLLISEIVRTDTRMRLVAAVSCRNKSTDQIETGIKDAINQIDSRLKSHKLEDVLRVIPTILVLDDFYHPQSQSAPTMAGELASRLSSAFARDGGLKLVVTGGVGSAHREPLLGELKQIVGENRSRRIALGQLSQSDVAWFLNRCMKVDLLTARSMARIIGGDPIKVAGLVSASRVTSMGLPALQAMTRRLEETEAVDLHPSNPRIRELEDLVSQVRAFGPTTYLTGAVLALSANGMTIENCVKLVRSLVIDDRLKIAGTDATDSIGDVRAVLNKPLQPFIIENAFGIELHARVKTALARSVPEVLGEDGARILHCRLAKAALARLPVTFSRSYVPSTANLADFLDLLQHVMDLYAMAPNVPTARQGREPLLPKSEGPFDPDAFIKLLDDPVAIKSRHSIANAAFDTLMLSRVGKEGDERMLTRQFGDFEQKLALLSRFLVDRDLTNPEKLQPIPELRSEFASHVLLDVAVCANQAGLIDVAHGAIRRRQHYRNAESTGTIFDAMLGILRRPNSLEDGDLARLAGALEGDSEHINVYVSVLVREGELVDARTFVDRYAGKATDVIAELDAVRSVYAGLSVRARRPINSILVSCRRLLAKRGQVLTYAGHLQSALIEFERAIHADEYRRGGTSDAKVTLSGETGRSFCLALAALGGEENLATAAACIEQNIQKATASLRTYDMLDWFTLQAAIFRLQGNREAAASSLANAEQIRREDGVALSFMSLVTLTIEQERQKLRSPKGQFTAAKLKPIHEVAVSSRHKLLACDAALLLAEASTGRERTNYMRSARSMIRDGYGFRIPDADALDMGQSCAHLI